MQWHLLWIILMSWEKHKKCWIVWHVVCTNYTSTFWSGKSALALMQSSFPSSKKASWRRWHVEHMMQAWPMTCIDMHGYNRIWWHELKLGCLQQCLFLLNLSDGVILFIFYNMRFVKPNVVTLLRGLLYLSGMWQD